MEIANSEITALPGCYLLVILGEPLCENHKEKILQRVAKGLLSWNTEETQCDLKHLEQVCDSLKTSQKSSGKTELLLQHSTDKLAVEVLFNPQIFTLKQCLRNLLLSPTGHKHVIHAGYSFTGSGSWILQDGIFRFHDFVDELSDPGVTKVLSLYPPGCSLKMHLHCSPTGDWVTNNLENQAFSHFMHLSLNPPDSPNGVPGASSLLEFIEGSLETLEGEEKLEPSPLIGNIRFERPTMYIFPSGQGDCSLFGVTGFTMLIDGGFTRFPCFWKFVRHIERLDSIMITRINESNLWGILSLLRGKQESSLYLKIGYVFCNIVDKSINSSEEGVNNENGGVASIQSNPNDLTISIIEVGNEIASRLKRIGCNPHQCLRDPTPTQLTLYHKVGHGTLEMFILSPPRDSRLLKDFLAHWSSNKDSLPVVRTRSACKNGGQSGQDIAIPISDVMSICCLLIWKPSNPNDRITRILFPGSAPQSQIMEGLASLKDLDLLQKRVCTASSLKQSKSKSTVKSTVRISETSSTSTATQKLSTRYRSVSPSMRKTRVPYAKQSSTEVGDKGGDSSESQSSPVKRKLIPATNHQTETSRATRVSTRESVKKTAHEEKKSAKNVTEKKIKTRTSSTTRSTTNKATSKPSSEPTSEANETVKARPITSKQVRARINSRRVSDKTTSETDNETKKEIQSCTVTAENGDSDFSDKKRETVEVCSEDDHRDSGKGSEDASPKKLPFLDHLRDEVEPDSLESYEIYGNVEISKDSLEHSEDEVVTGDSRSTSQLDHMISREDDDEDMKSRSSPIQEDSNLQSAMVSSLSSNMSEMTIISGDKNDDSASDLEVASLTSRINNNQMSRSIEISHVEGSRRKSTDSNGSFRTLEAEIKAACMEEDRQSIGSSSRKSSILSDADKRRDSIVKENIFASETTSHGKQEVEKSAAPERRRSSIIAGDDAYRRASISKEGDKLERKLSKSNEYQIEQEIEDLKVDTKLGKEVSTGEIVPKEQGFQSSKADSLEFKEESIERFSEKLTQNEMQISSKKKDSSGSLEDELPKGSIEEGESLRKDSVRLSIDKSMEEKKIEESTIKSEIETSGQNDIEPIVPESKDNVNEAEVISKETDIDSKEILSTDKEKLLIDSSKSHSDFSSELLSQSQSETSLDIESTKQKVDDKNKMVQSVGQSLTHGSDDREAMESVTDSQQSVIASTESTSESEKKKQEEEQLTLKTGETLRKDSITSESKAESQVCDENVGAYKIDEEEQKLNSESASSIETSNQSQVITSEESDRKMSGENSSSIETENKDSDDKLHTSEGVDIKQDSFASRKESIKTSETLSSSGPASDGKKPESRKGSMASDETKQQITSTADEYSNIDGDWREKRESVSDVFDLESEKDTKNIEIGFDEAVKTESSLGQIDRKESVQLDKERSSISSDSRKRSLTSEPRKSIDSPFSPIDRKESITHEESQIGRKDSVQFDFDKSKSVDSRRSTETEIQYNAMASMESDSRISGQISSSIQDERKESVQLEQVRSSISDDSRKLSLSSETMQSNESLLNQSDRKGSVQLKDKISEGTTNDDRSSSSEITRRDSVQSDFDQRQSLDSRRSTETEIQYNTMESDSKISGQTSSSIQNERKESIQMDKERSSISGDSRRSTETDIQYKTITSVESDAKIITETSSQITRKDSVQVDKDRSSISGDYRKQSLTSEARKSIDSDEIKRRESISQQDDKVFIDSVPASPLTKHQDKSDEIIQSNAKHEDSSIGVVKTAENIESKNTQQSNLLERVPFETENLNLSKSESTLSDDKKGGDDQKSHDIPSQLSSSISSVSSNTKSDEQTKVDKSEFEDIKRTINYDIESNDVAENKSISEHCRKPSIDITPNKLSTITSTTDSSSTESNTTNTTAIIDQHSTSDSVDSESFSMQDANKQTAGQKSIEVTTSQAEAKELEISKEILTISKDDSTSTSKTSITETTSITATNTIQSDTESSISKKSESSSSIVQPESAESYSKSIPELQEKSMVQSSESEIDESKSSDSVKPIQTETKPSEDYIKLEEQIGKSEKPGVDSKLRKESLKESVEAQKVSLQSSDVPCKSNEEDIIQEEILRKSSVDIIAQQNSENGEKSKGTDSKRSSIDVEIQKANYSIGSNSIEQKTIHEEESKSALLATDQITQKSESKVEESKSKESTEAISSETEKGSVIQSQESSTFEKIQCSIVQQTSDDSGSREQVESLIQATSFSTESSPKGDQKTSFTMDLSSTADESSKIIASSVDDKAKQSTSEVSNGLAEKRDSTTSVSVEASDKLQQSQIVSGQATQLSNEISEKIIVDSKDNILQSSDSVSETKQLKDLEEKRGSVSKTDDERRTSLATDSATIREIFTTSDSDGSISYSVGGSILTTSVSRPEIEQETKLETSSELSEKTKDISSQSADVRTQFEERKQSIVSSTKELEIVESSSTETVVSTNVVESKLVGSSLETTSGEKDVTSSGITKLYLGQVSGFESCEDSESHEAEHIQSPKNIGMNNNLISSDLKEASDDLASDLEVASLTSKMDGSAKMIEESKKEYESKVTLQNECVEQLSSENYSSDARVQYSAKDSDDKLNTTVGDDGKQDSFASRKESIKTSETFSSSEPASDGKKPESRKSSMASDETKHKITSTADEYSKIDGDSRQFQHSFTSQDTEMKSSTQTVSSGTIIETKEASLKRESVSDVFDLESENDSKNIEIGFDETVKTESSLGQIDRKESVQLDKERSSISSDSRKRSLTSEPRKSIDSPFSPIDRKESITHEESQIGRKDSVQFDFDKSKSVDSRRSTETEIQYNTMASMESDLKTSGQMPSSTQITRKDSVQVDKDRSSISGDYRKQSLTSEPRKSIDSDEIKRRESISQQDDKVFTDSVPASPLTKHQDKSDEIIQSDKERSSISGADHRSTETDIHYKTITSVESDTKISTESSPTLQIARKESIQLDKDRSSISGDSRKQSLSSEAIKPNESSSNQPDREGSVQLKDTISEGASDSLPSSQITRKDSVQSDFDHRQSLDSRRSNETEVHYNTVTSMEIDSKTSGQTSSSIELERKDSVQMEEERSSLSGGSRRSTEIHYNTVTSMDSDTKFEDSSSPAQSTRKDSVHLDKDRSSISDDKRKQSLTSESIEYLFSQLERKQSEQLKDAKSESEKYGDSSVSFQTSQTIRKDSVQADLDKSNVSSDSRRSTETEIQYEATNELEKGTASFGDSSSSSQITRKNSVQTDKERSSISGDSRRSTETDIQYKTVESDSKVSTETSASSQITRKDSVQSDRERSSISDYPRKQSLSSATRKSIDSDEIKRRESISQQEDKVFTDSVPASPLTKHQDKSDEIIQSNVKHEDSSIGVVETTENIESKNTQQSNLLERVPFETENLNLSKSESTLSDDKKSHDIPGQLSSTILSSSSNEQSDEQTKVTMSESMRKYSQSESDNKFYTTSAIKSNDETENNRITEHRRKPSIDMTSNKLTTTTDSYSTESKTTITTGQINFGANMIGSSYLGSDARTSFIETNIQKEVVDETKAIVAEIDDAARKSMLVDKSISLDSIDTTDSIKQSTGDKVTNKSTTSGNTLVQSGDSFAQQTSELKRESFSKIEANNQLYSTLTESFDDIQVDLQSTKSSNLTSSNFSDAKFLNKSESLSSENATHSTKFDTVMSIDEETYFYLEDSDSLAQDGHSMASIASDKRVTKEGENNKITLSETTASHSSTTQKHDLTSSTPETKQQLLKLSEFSSFSEAEQPAKTIETSQKSQMETKDSKSTDSSHESRVEKNGNKISGNLVSDSVQEKMIIKSSDESGSTVMIEERSSIDYKPFTSFSESSFGSSSASSATNQTKGNSENLVSLKEEMDKSKSISSSDESKLKTSDEALSGKILSSSAYSGASHYTEEEPFESGYAPFAKCVGIKKIPSQPEPDSWTNVVSTTKSFTVESSDQLEGEDRHHTKQYEADEGVEEKMKSSTLSNQSSAKLVSPTLSPLPGQSFDKLSRDIVDKGVSLRSMAATELASSIVHLESSVTKVTTNLNLPEVISEEAGSKGEESPDLSSPKQSTNDFIAKVETAPGAGTLATTFPTAGEMPSVHLRRSAQMAGQVLYEVPDEEDNVESPLSEKKPVGLARGTTSSVEFPEVLHISEETTPSTPSETQSPRDAKSLTQTTTVTTTSMDITSPQDSKSGLCCFPRSIELDGIKKGKEEKVTSTSTSETTTRVVTQSQNLTEEQKKEKEATLKEWGTPLGLPKPTDANDSKGARSASKSRAISSDRTGASRSYSSRRSGSSSDIKPIYLDLAYIPHHGDRHYCNADYFKRIRARYYVLSSVNPSKEVLDALIEGKKSWEDKAAEVTLIPSHETEALCLWMATNQRTLEDLNIDVAPSASRCSVILQDQESSCSAYRVEF